MEGETTDDLSFSEIAEELEIDGEIDFENIPCDENPDNPVDIENIDVSSVFDSLSAHEDTTNEISSQLERKNTIGPSPLSQEVEGESTNEISHLLNIDEVEIQKITDDPSPLSQEIEQDPKKEMSNPLNIDEMDIQKITDDHNGPSPLSLEIEGELTNEISHLLNIDEVEIQKITDDPSPLSQEIEQDPKKEMLNPLNIDEMDIQKITDDRNGPSPLSLEIEGESTNEISHLLNVDEVEIQKHTDEPSQTPLSQEIEVESASEISMITLKSDFGGDEEIDTILSTTNVDPEDHEMGTGELTTDDSIPLNSEIDGDGSTTKETSVHEKSTTESITTESTMTASEVRPEEVGGPTEPVGDPDLPPKKSRFYKIIEAVFQCVTCCCIWGCSTICMQITIFIPTLLLPEMVMMALCIVCIIPFTICAPWGLGLIMLMVWYIPVSVPYAVLMTCFGAPILSLVIDLSFRYGRWICFCYYPCEEMGRVWALDELPNEKKYSLIRMIFKKTKRLVKKVVNIIVMTLLLIVSESKLFLTILFSFIVSIPSKDDTFSVFDNNRGICFGLGNKGLGDNVDPLVKMCISCSNYQIMSYVFYGSLVVGIVFTCLFIFVEITATGIIFRGFSSHRLKYMIVFGSYQESFFRRVFHIALYVIILLYSIVYWLFDLGQFLVMSSWVSGRIVGLNWSHFVFSIPYLLLFFVILLNVWGLITYDGESSIDYVKFFYFSKYSYLPDIHGNILTLLFANPGEVLYQVQSTIALLGTTPPKEGDKRMPYDEEVKCLKDSSRFGHMNWSYIAGLSERELVIMKSFFVEDYQGLKENSVLNICCFSPLFGKKCLCNCLSFCCCLPFVRKFKEGFTYLMVFKRFVTSGEVEIKKITEEPLKILSKSWKLFEEFYVDEVRTAALKKQREREAKLEDIEMKRLTMKIFDTVSYRNSISQKNSLRKLQSQLPPDEKGESEEIEKQQTDTSEKSQKLEKKGDLKPKDENPIFSVLDLEQDGEVKSSNDEKEEELPDEPLKSEEGEQVVEDERKVASDDGEDAPLESLDHSLTKSVMNLEDLLRKDEIPIWEKLCEPKRALTTAICCPKNCCCVSWVYVKLMFLFAMIVMSEVFAFFGVVWASVNTVGAGDEKDGMCSGGDKFSGNIETARRQYCQSLTDLKTGRTLYLVFQILTLVLVGFILFIDTIVKFFFLIFFTCNKLKFLLVYCVLREWIVYRVLMIVMFSVCFGVCFVVLCIKSFAFGGLSYLDFISFAIQAGFVCIVFVIKTNGVLSYDGPSSSSFYYSLVARSYCSCGFCCIGPVCFKDFVLPDINAGFPGIVFGNPDQILQQVVTCLALVTCKDDMKEKKDISKFAHFGWGYVSSLSDIEIRRLQIFFFGESIDSRQTKTAALCFTTPKKCKFWVACYCFLCCCCFCFANECCFTHYCSFARKMIKEKYLTRESIKRAEDDPDIENQPLGEEEEKEIQPEPVGDDDDIKKDLEDVSIDGGSNQSSVSSNPVKASLGKEELDGEGRIEVEQVGLGEEPQEEEKKDEDVGTGNEDVVT